MRILRKSHSRKSGYACNQVSSHIPPSTLPEGEVFELKRISIILLSMVFIILLPPCINATGLIFETGQFSFQALRTIGYAVNGGADIGECLSTCSRIVDGDTESWYSEWLAVAERVEAKADSFLVWKHTASARECYFRASGYYRTAEFFLHTVPADPRIVETWERSRNTFLSAAALSDHPILPVEIPFEGGSLPAYLCLVDDSGEPRPLIVAHSGFDGTKEELYFSIGSPAIERGYNCLLFEGPGQGEVIRLQHIPFRPDWESVVSPVIDFVVEFPFVDTERIVLIGYSMGGYFAPRAVTAEHRIAACVANGGLYSVYESLLSNNPPGLDSILDDEEASLEYDSTIYGMMEENLYVQWFYSNGMWVFDASSPSNLVLMMRTYTLRDCVSDISCEMLVLDSEHDMNNHGQAIMLYDSLRSPKEYILFTEEDGADEHCQMGAIAVSNERIFNWLNSVLDQNQLYIIQAVAEDR